ncbi:MAG: ATP-binding protein [Defluviitaleaceae bacterium]|nr:ATP-binding protein [Defluviitaleaceae bacterium]
MPDKELIVELNALKRKFARLQKENENVMHLYKQAASLRDFNEKAKEIQIQYNQMLRENCPDEIYLLDMNFCVLICTYPAKERFKRDITGEPFLSLTEESFGNNFMRELSSHLLRHFESYKNTTQKEPAQKGHCHLEADGGQKFFYSVNISPAYGISGELAGVVVLIHDNTEMNNANIRAEAATRAKSNFLANMSHEIRTPLNAIVGMTNIGMTTPDPDRKAYCFNRISDASNHLLGIINDILDMSKIESGRFELSPCEFDFEKLLHNIINVITFRADEHKQKLLMSCDKRIPNNLICDDQRLSQVITNLLGNALKFTPDGGSVSVNAELLGEKGNVCEIQVNVTDTGIGISAEQQERLFVSFQQAEATTARKFGGTGLGLIISKNIVEMMGGRIWIVSELGMGATFSFTFKAERAGGVHYEPLQNESVKEDLTEKFSGCRLLLAEDVEINREIVAAILEPTKIQIDFAENGLEAVKMFSEAEDAYDMIFMDLQMPEMDGYEATRKIRAIGSHRAAAVPIIAMTANVFREDVERCIESGMNGHIGKPLDFDEVIEQMEKYI